MVLTHFFCKYGLIGENLDLKQNINLEINDTGIISKIIYDEPDFYLNTIDLKENYLMIPGLINSHIHIGDSFAKERGFNKNLVEVVAPPNGIKHKMLEKTPPEVQIEGIRKAILDMLSNGITTFMDFREMGLEGIKILQKALEKININSYIYGRFNNVEEFDQIIENSDGIGLASYNNISTQIKNKLKLTKFQYKKLIASHIAEIKRDNDLLKEILEDDLVDIFVHCTHLMKEDLILIKKKKKKLILCPRCNGYFGVGIPPIKDLLDLKIPISLGTDNLMVNNIDLFEEMRFFYYLSRILSKDYRLNSRELLKMVTINAAKNFNLEDKIGSLAEGKYADFFIIDLFKPNFYSYKLDEEIIYPLVVQRTKSENIKKVYIKGKVVFERV